MDTFLSSFDLDTPDGLRDRAMFELMYACGIYTQMDQALPAQVADQMFAAQDNVVIGNMKPEEVGESVQTAIRSYLAENQ